MKFDFEKYSCDIFFGIDETTEERLEIMQEIERDSDYQLLRKCLLAKHDFEEIPDSNPEEYRKVLKEFVDWRFSRRGF